MVVRNGAKGSGKGTGTGYNLAYKCLHCEGFRWADVAESRGETHCLCGTKFPSRPVRMPFYRKGPPSTPRRDGASQALDAMSSTTPAAAAAKAKAKPGAKPKAKPTPAPWAGRSPTVRQSDGRAGDAADLHLDPTRVDDELYMIESFAKLARHFRKTDMIDQLEHSRRKAIRAKAEQMPPKQRVDHLRKRYKEAIQELKKLQQAQEATEEEIRRLKERSLEQYKTVEDQRELAGEIRAALEEAELDLPPLEKPQPVGPLDQASALRAALRRSSIPQILDELSDRYSKEFGTEISDERLIGRRTQQGFDMLQSAHDELLEERQKQKRQVEEDRRTAEKLHRELNPLEVQPGDKRGRAVDVDGVGDERMGDGSEENQADDDEWQISTGGRKKGKGGIGAMFGKAAAKSSAKGSAIQIPLGPLATAPRPAATGAREVRPSTTKKPLTTGTPAVATTSGTLQPSADGLEEEETPWLDSLPSTPRSGARTQEEEETPCIVENSEEKQVVPMETSVGIGEQQDSLGPVTVPAAAGQPIGDGCTN